MWAGDCSHSESSRARRLAPTSCVKRLSVRHRDAASRHQAAGAAADQPGASDGREDHVAQAGWPAGRVLANAPSRACLLADLSFAQKLHL